MFWCLTLLALLASAQGRAVNISNTWMLPEEGFPVFYRYFRDRISWYEADAVCQFHHANLVTVDTTAQYDAVRAYLKELDISSAVWVGLIRSNPDGDFTWTDYRGLSGDGYWSTAPDSGSAPLCAAADPSADYRWEARACGGPMVASFICELPVPQWASGSQGCMVKALPALTVLYLPESASVQLTTDCGLAGVKRVQCTGNVKREVLLKQLSCGVDLDDSTSTISTEATTENSWSIPTEKQMNRTQVSTTEDSISTKYHNIGTYGMNYNMPTDLNTKPLKHKMVSVNHLDTDAILKISHMNNNMESNEIPQQPDNFNEISEEEANKLEDEKHMQHKMIHEELARLGNSKIFEKIFTQSSDHFVPPLVMAKSKISDDMNVLSIEEKHAQQLAEEQANLLKVKNNKKEIESKEQSEHYNSEETLTGIPFKTTTDSYQLKDKTYQKEFKQGKTLLPKKFKDKLIKAKSKQYKSPDKTSNKVMGKVIDINTSQKETTTIMQTTDYEQPSIELSVVLKEPEGIAHKLNDYTVKHSRSSKLSEKSTESIGSTETPEFTHEIIQVTIPNNMNTSGPPIVFEITTRSPIFNDVTTHTETLEVVSPKTGYNSNPIAHTSKYENVYDDTTPESFPNNSTITVLNEITSINYNNISSNTENVTSLETTVNTTEFILPLDLLDEKTQRSIKDIEPTILKDVVELSIETTKSFNERKPIISTTTEKTNIFNETETIISLSTVKSKTISETEPVIIISTEITKTLNETEPAVIISTEITKTLNETELRNTFSTEITKSLNEPELTKSLNETEPLEEIHEQDSEPIDDFQSPLLSAASEPVHRPSRQRRLTQNNQNRIVKFNPFRILG